jgi:drug/metabolite transporter (DMT)-like permease
MKQGQAQHFIGYVMVAIATLLFGLYGNLSRLLFDDGISPLTLVEFRMLIGAICLFVFLLVWRRSLLKLPSGNWGWTITFGLCLAMVAYTSLLAISRLPLAIASVITFTATAWMAVGESIWRKRLPSPPVILAIVLTFGGVILVTGVWQQSFNGLDGLGILYAHLTMLCYIAYLLSGRRVGRTLPTLTSTSYGALVASIFCLVVQPPWLIPATTWQPQYFLLLLLMGIIGMALPFSLILAALRHIDATRVGIANTLEVVTTSVIAYFWLGQHLTIWQTVGCILVPIGVIILQYEQQVLQ